MNARKMFYIYVVFLFTNFSLVKVGPFNILPTDIITLFLFPLFLLKSKKIQMQKSILVYMLLIAILNIISGLFLSKDPMQKLFSFENSFLLLYRIIPFLAFSNYIIGEKDERNMYTRIYFLFTVANLLVFVVYIYFLINIEVIISNPQLWDSPYFPFQLGQAGILRYQMFVGDPNFFAWITIILTYLYHFFADKVNVSFIIINLIILLFTFSRTGYILLLFYLIYLLFYFFRIKLKILFILGTLILFLCLSYFSVDLSHYYLFSKISIIFTPERMQTLTGRTFIWRNFLNEIKDANYVNLLLGFGPRFSIIQSGLYMHNSYLEIFQEQGLIGLLLFVLWVFYLLLKIKQLNSLEKKIILYFLLLSNFIFMLTFSIFYNIFLWISFWIMLNAERFFTR